MTQPRIDVSVPMTPLMSLVRDRLAATEYRRVNHRWTVIGQDCGFVHVRLCVTVKNVEDGSDLYVTFNAAIQDNANDKCIDHVIYSLVREYELHELDEHYFVDGVKVYDPHKREEKR